MKKYCKLFILAAALMGGLSLNSCIDLDPIDYSDINPSNFHKRKQTLSRWSTHATTLYAPAGSTGSSQPVNAE